MQLPKFWMNLKDMICPAIFGRWESLCMFYFVVIRRFIRTKDSLFLPEWRIEFDKVEIFLTSGQTFVSPGIPIFQIVAQFMSLDDKILKNKF